MPTIDYIADSFPKPFAAVNGKHTMDVSWPFLMWSAISVGRAHLFHLLQYGEYSLLEIVYRAAMFYANLRQESAGQIVPSAAYIGLDPSEKGAISYFFGLAMAKAFAEKILNVPWLMHLDVYRKELMVALAGKSRPDLVGQNAGGQWIAIEAKGRSNGFEMAVLNRAKGQAAMLHAVGGKQPALRNGMVTHFGGGRLQFRVSDPPPDEHQRRVDLPLNRAQLIEGYYRPFRTFLSSSEETVELKGERFRIAHADVADLEVGLTQRRMQRDVPDITIEEDQGGGEEYYVGRDGILVRLGPMWSPSNMALEPQSRTRI